MPDKNFEVRADGVAGKRPSVIGFYVADDFTGEPVVWMRKGDDRIKIGEGELTFHVMALPALIALLQYAHQYILDHEEKEHDAR